MKNDEMTVQNVIPFPRPQNQGDARGCLLLGMMIALAFACGLLLGWLWPLVVAAQSNPAMLP